MGCSLALSCSIARFVFSTVPQQFKLSPLFCFFSGGKVKWVDWGILLSRCISVDKIKSLCWKIKFYVTLTCELCSLCKEAQYLQPLGLPDHTAVLTVQGKESAMTKSLHQENQTVCWKLALRCSFKLSSSSLHQVTEWPECSPLGSPRTKELDLIVI